MYEGSGNVLHAFVGHRECFRVRQGLQAESTAAVESSV